MTPIEKQLNYPSGPWIKGWRSENIGGLVSMAGSCLFLFGGDASGFLVSASFLVAEIVLTKSGHTRYSAVSRRNVTASMRLPSGSRTKAA